MITPKTYLDNLQGCKYCGTFTFPGSGIAPCHSYAIMHKSIGYSFDFYEPFAEKCHIVSFDKKRDGRWYQKVLDDLTDRFGKPNDTFELHGIDYYVWKEAKEA